MFSTHFVILLSQSEHARAVTFAWRRTAGDLKKAGFLCDTSVSFECGTQGYFTVHAVVLLYSKSKRNGGLVGEIALRRIGTKIPEALRRISTVRSAEASMAAH
jgi:hypothetical protein